MDFFICEVKLTCRYWKNTGYCIHQICSMFWARFPSCLVEIWLKQCFFKMRLLSYCAQSQSYIFVFTFCEPEWIVYTVMPKTRPWCLCSHAIDGPSSKEEITADSLCLQAVVRCLHALMPLSHWPRKDKDNSYVGRNLDFTEQTWIVII